MTEQRGLGYWTAAARQTATEWRESVRSETLPIDVTAGISTALVALPLNIALAIACGLPPSVGIWTGAVAGLLGAAFGGARLQVTGPEVALAPLVFLIVSEHGFPGLLWATLIAGVVQIAMAVGRIGGLVRRVPSPVVLGFLAAVGLMVVDSQLPRILGLPDTYRLVSETRDLEWIGAIDLSALALGVMVVATVLAVPRLHPRIPAPLVAMALAVGGALLFGLSAPRVQEVEGLLPPIGLPPALDLETFSAVLPEGIALALLASLDTLLCAQSLDVRLGARHRSDQELAAQGVANICCAFVGGMPVAGAIVRSAAAMEAGARTRMAPLVQSIALGIVLLALAPVIHVLPIAALAAILLVVGVKLVEVRLLRSLVGRSPADAAVALGTTLAILLTDFVLGVGVGVVLALLSMAWRQSKLELRVEARELPRGNAGPSEEEEHPLIHVRPIGPLFFGNHAELDARLDAIPASAIVLDLGRVPTIDLTALETLSRMVTRLRNRGTDIIVCGASTQVAGDLRRVDVDAGRPLEAALAAARRLHVPTERSLSEGLAPTSAQPKSALGSRNSQSAQLQLHPSE